MDCLSQEVRTCCLPEVLVYFFKILILGYLPSRSEVTRFPLCYASLVSLTAGALRLWKVDKPGKDMTGFGPAVILIFDDSRCGVIQIWMQ